MNFSNGVCGKAFNLLENGEFALADTFCDMVLKDDSRIADAYVGKLMASLKVTVADELKNVERPFDNNENYINAMKYADDETKTFLMACNIFINSRNEKAGHSSGQLSAEETYTKAKTLMSVATGEAAFVRAAELFDSAGDFKDAAELSRRCIEIADDIKCKESYEKAVEILKDADCISDFVEAAELFNSIKGYKDSEELLKICAENAKQLDLEDKEEGKSFNKFVALLVAILGGAAILTVIGSVIVNALIWN